MLRLVLTLLIVSLSAGAHAAGNLAETTLVLPCRPAPAPITLDGTLDPAEWAGAIEVSGFRVSGSPTLAPEQVTLRALYDKTSLYLGVRCLESQMAKVKAAVRTHDGPFWEDDAIEFFIDASHNHQNYWQFAATAGGARYENRDGDSAWNADWKLAVSREQDAWVVEVAVPFHELGLEPPAPGSLWGFNLCRERQAGGRLELYNWADVKRVFQSPGLFGHLYFAPAGWQADAASVRDAARKAEGRETLIFVEGGYWRVRGRRAPEQRSYQMLLDLRARTTTGQMTELRALYRDRPGLKMREEFTRLDSRLAEVEALARTDKTVDALEWSRAAAFLDNLQERVDAIYWHARLALLNEKL